MPSSQPTPHPKPAVSRPRASSSKDHDNTCKKCSKNVGKVQSLQCDGCQTWFHLKCSKVPKSQYEFFRTCENTNFIPWFCEFCVELCRNPEKTYSEAVVPLRERETRLEGLVETLVKTLTTQNERLLTQTDRLIEQNDKILQLLSRDRENEKSFQTEVKQAINDEKEKEMKKDNLMIFNAAERASVEMGSTKTDAGTIDFIKDVLKTAHPELAEEDIVSIERLGKMKESNIETPRPVKVKLRPSEDLKGKIFRGTKEMKKNTRFASIVVTNDKTSLELQRDKELRNELTSMRQKNPTVEYVIFKGKVVEKSYREAMREGSVWGDGAVAPPARR